ncbi:DUF3876 domain-containing protein [Bacteroides sp. 519]|uniref:DUF3876 domain-containing protein n=1 Tax=Bacteroides sp. 519 TaxID=2302937 RepID=UPI0013D1DAA4|nr:DUF3876 domain-containing protein [Bacteroides sp. 519]NDV56686.1 DUF3876 domain-containing protein [Bacteroides sp. 519]
MKLSNEQLTRLTLYTAGINSIFAEALLKAQAKKPADTENVIEPEAFVIDWDAIENAPPIPIDWQAEERQRREQAMSRLCGRWTMGNYRCGIEITREGEHFVLTHLKRNGRATDERYVLIWLDGDILYYGYGDRITVLALNTETDTLMVSPGVNYTRWAEEQK